MEITVILQWLTGWILFVLAQSVFINGVYQSATGETKKRVDGSDEDSEMILYPVKKFFERLKKVSIYYKGQELNRLIDEIGTADPMGYIFNFENIGDGIISHSRADNKWLRSVIEIIEARHSVYIWDRGDRFQIVKIYEDYYYSKWLRKPIIQCIKCMGSLWGALTFWPVVLFLFGFNLLEVPIFFADVFSLTYINWILYKKAQ